MLSDSNARLAAARRLTSRRVRRETGRFLAEGAQAVREALSRPGTVLEIFGTREGLDRNADALAPAQRILAQESLALGILTEDFLAQEILAQEIRVDEISDKAAAALSETVSPQGIVAVCRVADSSLGAVLAKRPRLIAVLVEANDPGNAGSILRTADAAGAQAVIFAGGSVDPYNGKAVRATAGSLFHLDVVTGVDPVEAVNSCRAAGLLTLASTGAGSRGLYELLDAGLLARPTAWLFGNEARGLGEDLVRSADLAVKVPIHGKAESLNLAAAAALCLYASARAHLG